MHYKFNSLTIIIFLLIAQLGGGTPVQAKSVPAAPPVIQHIPLLKPIAALQTQALEPLAPVYVPPPPPVYTRPVAVAAPVTPSASYQVSGAGYPNGYDAGQCTFWVASNIKVPDNLGNAADWATNAAAQGFTVSSVPKPGAVAQRSTPPYGHVAIVIGVSGDQVEVSEMNRMGVGVVNTAWYPTSSFNYIYF